MKKTMKKVYDFFVQDDTKIKIECTTNAFWDAKKQTLTVKRKFYTFRSLYTFAWWYVTKNPYEKAKKYLEDMKAQPEYAFKMAGYFAVFLIGALADIKNVSNLTLVAGAIAYDTTSSSRDGTAPITFSHTCTGSNLVLTVGTSGVRAQSAVTYNSVSMTAGTQESDGSGWSRMWYLGNPATGANTVDVTLASDGDTMTGAISFSGANAASPLDQEDTSSVNGTDLSMTVTTSYANSFLVDTVHKQANATANGTQTVRWSGTADYYAGSTKPTTTAGAYSTDWSGSSTIWGGAMIAVRELSASTSNNLTLLGVGT